MKSRVIDAIRKIHQEQTSADLLLVAWQTGATQEFLAHLCYATGLFLHHNLVLADDGTIIRDEWWAATADFVSGSQFAYESSPPPVDHSDCALFLGVPVTSHRTTHELYSLVLMELFAGLKGVIK